MAAIVYNIGKDRISAGAIPNGATIIRAVVIVTSKTGADNPDLATVAAIDAVGTVALGTERVTVTGVTKAVDNANDRVNIDSADVTFAAAAGVTALAILFYDATTDTNDGTRIPISFDDTNFGAGVPMDGGLVYQTPNGILRVA